MFVQVFAMELDCHDPHALYCHDPHAWLIIFQAHRSLGLGCAIIYDNVSLKIGRRDISDLRDMWSVRIVGNSFRSKGTAIAGLCA